MPASEVSAFKNSRALWDRACDVMPGGVNASARINPALGHALFFQRGEGAHLYDVDGHRYIDYCTSHGASLLGHGHPAIVAAVQEALSMGVLLAYETEIQVEVAEQLVRMGLQVTLVGDSDRVMSEHLDTEASRRIAEVVADEIGGE